MFEVLVYVYENYWQGDACPELTRLSRKLTAVGFDAEEIQAALVWLDGLNMAAQGARGNRAASAATNAIVNTASMQPQSASSLRVYSVAEQMHLGAQSLGFVSFLESSGDPVTLDDLKIIVLMVYWSFGEEPDALVLDELCDDAQCRVAH